MKNDIAEILGFDRILELIADGAISESAKECILSVKPFPSKGDSLRRMRQIATLQLLWEKGEKLPLRYFEDIRSELSRCRVEGSYLFAGTLLEILKILQQGIELITFYKKHRDNLSVLEDLFLSLKPMNPEIALLSRIVDEDTRIKDSAGRDLARIRRRIQQTTSRLRREIDRVMNKARQENWLHEENPTIRDGRFVLPLRSEAKRKIKGIIHGQSATGATSYVEPLVIVEINNTLKELEIAEQDEIERILIRVTDTLRPLFSDIRQTIQVLSDLDFLNAGAAFSRRFRCTIPRITDRGRVELINARHPLLTLVKEVVPLNVSIKDNIRCVIITGPNAGGKTVAMKTVGLLSMMVKCGLPIPAESGSELPFFDQILIDIGDRQSIEDDLSTFTSHVLNLKYILDKATPDSLILIDELGTGTDPLEGSALGRAVLEELVNRESFTVITTHHSGLKAFADQHPRVTNAAMEFDSNKLQATYRFQLGLPGSSYALEISRRMGLTKEVIDRARELMGGDQVKLEHLLIEVDTLKSKIEKENQSVERNKKTLDKLITEYEAKLTSIREKHESMDAKIAEELERLVNESRSKIEHAVKDIREREASRETIIRAQKTLNSIKQSAQKKKKRRPSKEKSLTEEIKKGDTVNVDGISGIGYVRDVQNEKRRAAVDVNGKRIWVSFESLHKVHVKAAKDSIHSSVSAEPERLMSFRLDLRGRRFDEARDELERFLDRALLAGLNQVQIIHGKGTGTLQKMTQEVLKNTRGVRKFYYENFDKGGTGVTIAELS